VNVLQGMVLVEKEMINFWGDSFRVSSRSKTSYSVLNHFASPKWPVGCRVER